MNRLYSSGILLVVCLLGSVSGADAENQKEGNCTGWEIELYNKLSSQDDVFLFFKIIEKNLTILSDVCIQTFNKSVNISHARMLVKMLNNTYDNLTSTVKKAVYEWIVRLYINTTADPKVTGQANTYRFWITADVLRLMDRFLLQAPLSTLSGMVTQNPTPLYDVFSSADNHFSFFYDLKQAQADVLYAGLRNACRCDFTSPGNISRLGQLACFYPENSSPLQAPAMDALFKLLNNCRSNVRHIYEDVLSKVNVAGYNATQLSRLSAAVVGLSEAQLTSLNASAVKGALDTFAQNADLSGSQKEALLSSVSEGIIQEGNLGSLGLLASHLSSDTLMGINASEFRKAFQSPCFARSIEGMEPVQKKAILLSILKSTNLSEALSFIPPSLISVVPCTDLRALGNFSSNWTNAFPWNKAQAIVVMEKVFSSLKTTNDFRALLHAVRGLTCTQIQSMTKSQLEAVSASPFLSRDQVRCASASYYRKLKTPDNMTEAKLKNTPPSFLVYAQSFAATVNNIPRLLCSSVVDLLARASPALLTRNSPRRAEILSYIMACYNATNASGLSLQQINSLGGAACFLGQEDIGALSAAQFREAADQLSDCGEPEPSVKTALLEKITAVYGDVPHWRAATLMQLRSLVMLFDLRFLYKLPVSVELKEGLALLLPQRRAPGGFVPEKLHFAYDSSSVSQLYAKMVLRLAAVDTMFKRDICSKVPTTLQIKAIGNGNSILTPAQLECLDTNTFQASLEVLASVPGFSPLQLAALKTVALKAFPEPADEDIAALKRITLAFTSNDVSQSITMISIDTLSSIGQYRDWLNNLRVAKEILAIFLKDNPVNTLTSRQLIGLKYFLCAFTADQVKQLSAEEYSAAAREIGQLECPAEVLLALQEKAVEAYGDPSLWTKDEMDTVGTVTASLNSTQISSISAGTLSYITPEAISLIPSSVFRVRAGPALLGGSVQC
nr:PREDICTED: otoancorin-like isoform X1 [Lepisosteus oculatus]XP_015193273.1 PREDICTED: otoancorin-like isoform X1 [Lepisosteus oculatus]